MTYPFPPPSPESVSLQYILLGWLGLLLIVFVWRLFRPVRGWEPLVWLPGVVVVMCVFILAPIRAAPDRAAVTFRPTLTTYAVAVCIVLALVAFIVNIVRLIRQKQTGWAIGTLLGGTGGMMVICLLPAMASRASPAARRSNCSSNMKYIALVMHVWHDEHGRFPGVDNSEEGNPPLSWRVAALPFLDEQGLREDYDDTKSWDDPANLEVARRKSSGLQCPSHVAATDADERRFTAYVLVTGPQTIAPGGKGLSFPEITDGTSQTLLTVERPG